MGNILGVPFCLIPLSSTYFAISYEYLPPPLWPRVANWWSLQYTHPFIWFYCFSASLLQLSTKISTIPTNITSSTERAATCQGAPLGFDLVLFSVRLWLEYHLYLADIWPTRKRPILSCFAVTLGFVVASRYGPIELAALTSALCVVAIGAGASRLLVNTRKVVRVGENHISDWISGH